MFEVSRLDFGGEESPGGKVVSIVSARGWWAKYEVEGEAKHSRVIVWALTEEGRIAGAFVGVFKGRPNYYLHDDHPNFKGYIFQGDGSDPEMPDSAPPPI